MRPHEHLKDAIKERYGRAAERVRAGTDQSTCGSCCGEGGTDAVTANIYREGDTEGLPAAAVAASLGCGNPAALAELRPGERVLDLGSGGGIDVLLSARRVGPTGRAYGLDMTDAMLELARENQRKAGVTNVEFLKGDIENIPLPDSSVDVIISNCVINLAADKDRVLREALRVLRPGGRLAVSDVVRRREVPAFIRRSVELWIGCVAGALSESEYRSKLANAGFEAIDLEPTRIYQVDDARAILEGAGLDLRQVQSMLRAAGIDLDAVAPLVDGAFMSAFVRARKPNPESPIPNPGS